VLELPEGSLVCCADVGGRPIVGPEGVSVRPAGLNVPLIAAALRDAALPEQPTGVAHLRWAEARSKPVGIPDGIVGIVGVVRLAVRRDAGSGWLDHGSDLHLWIVPRTENPTEMVHESLRDLVRCLLAATVRAKIDLDPDLIGKMRAFEASLIDQYRRRTEPDVEAGLRYAAFPLCAIVITD
jgi:hypothetical protein